MDIKKRILSLTLAKKYFELTKEYYYEKRNKEMDRLIKEESPEAVIRWMWKKSGIPYELNLEDPQSFNEKLQWLKLNWYDERARICANKLLVRDYVVERGLEHILNDLLAVYDKPEDIEWEQLPDRFVLKPTHDSGHVIVCKDKAELNKKKTINSLHKWLSFDYFKVGEWQYASTKKIICEKYLEDSHGQGLTDYKIFCFNGKPKFVQVDLDRFTNHVRNVYDLEWNYVPIQFYYPTDGTRRVQRPSSLNTMIEYAERLCAGFPFVRVDFYSWKDNIIFGELTFFHGGGYEAFFPNEKDFEIGQYLELPNIAIDPWEIIYKQYDIKNNRYNL